MVKLESILRRRYNIAHGLVTAAQNSPNARKVTGGLPWREAASVMLVSPTSLAQSGEGGIGTSSQSKPHFLVTQRSKTSGSFSSILCFPGGNSCKADADLKWINKLHGATGSRITGENREGVAFIGDRAEIPQIYNAAYKGPNAPQPETIFGFGDKVPKAVSLRITAIRETFEETGVLLVRLNDNESRARRLGREALHGVGVEASVHKFEEDGETEYWQELVRKDPDNFLKMCYQVGCHPDLNALVEWSDWLTPNCFGMQRYDTIFYMALLPQAYPLNTCPTEVDSAAWMTADEVLKDCEERKCKMITPQIYELSRLRTSTIKKISQLMKIRLRFGIERWCPAYVRAKDGYLSVFPGDDLYPNDLKIDVFEPIRSIDATLDELRESSIRQHRIEYRSEFDFRVVIKNYKERAGHVYLD